MVAFWDHTHWRVVDKGLTKMRSHSEKTKLDLMPKDLRS